MFRRITAAVLIILATILAPFAVGSLWVQQTVMNQERFVSTVGPLAANPAVQDVVATEATNAILEQLDTEARIKAALATADGPVASIIDNPVVLNALASGVTSAVTSGVSNFVHSEDFPQLWTSLAGGVQQGFANLVNRDTENAALKLQDGQLVLNTAIAVDKVREDLVARGVPFASELSVPGRDVVIADTPNLQTLADALRIFMPIASWMWLAVLAMFALGVFLWRPRVRGVMWAGLGFLLAGGLSYLGLRFGESAAARSAPSTYAEITGTVTSLLLRYLATGLLAMVAIGVALLLGGYLGGGTRTGRQVRDRIRGVAHGWGEPLAGGWLGRFTSEHQMFVPTLRALVLAGGVAVLFAVARLTPEVVLWTALGVAVLLLLVEAVEGAGRAYEGGRSGAVVASAEEPEHASEV